MKLNMTSYNLLHLVIILKGKWNPLHIAAQNGHAEVVELFIKSGADVNITTEVSLSVIRVNPKATIHVLL